MLRNVMKWGVARESQADGKSPWKSPRGIAAVDRLLRILGWILVLSAVARHFTYCEWRKATSPDDIIPFVIPGFYSHFWGLVPTQYTRDIAIQHGFLVPAGMILLGMTAICFVSLARYVRYDRRCDTFWAGTRRHWIALLVITGIFVGMYALVVLLGSLMPV